VYVPFDVRGLSDMRGELQPDSGLRVKGLGLKDLGFKV
jgi:hypothetical protein